MNPFKTFFMGGYECADHINRQGDRINLLHETEHHHRALADYQALAQLGIKVAREGVCWSEVEIEPFKFDFSEVARRLAAAEQSGIQLIWDLCHFGYPSDIYPTHPHFCRRFEALCTAFSAFHKNFTSKTLFVVPINEISFLSWHSGDVRGTVPFAVNSGFDIKYHLCAAAIKGIEKLKETDPNCRVILVEPLISIHGNEEACWQHIETMNENQFQAMDIIAGRMCKELGGSEDYLDILGFNYYWSSQWEDGSETLPWPENVERRTKVSTLIEMAYKRYQKPLFLSETGHFGEGRARWILEITLECREIIKNNIPFLGICIYPVTDRPDWDDITKYSDCGIFDLDADKNRRPHYDSLVAIVHAQRIIEEIFDKMAKIQAT